MICPRKGLIRKANRHGIEKRIPLIIDTLYWTGLKLGREFHSEKKLRLYRDLSYISAIIIRIVEQPGVDDSHEIGNYFKIIENNLP